MRICILLLAAGSGRRLGSELPKQYLEAAGKPLLLHALDSLAKEPRIAAVQPVIAEGDARFAAVTEGRDYPFELLAPVTGGHERAVSMARGVAAVPESCDWIGVHDAARPIPSQALLAGLFDAAVEHGAAVPGLAVVDTIKRVDGSGRILETLERASLRSVQTPQVARRNWFEQALVQFGDRLESFTDDAALLEAAGFPVYISPGEADNRKITTIDDLHWLEDRLGAAKG